MKNSNDESMTEYQMTEPTQYLAARPKDRAEQRCPTRCYASPLNIGGKIFEHSIIRICFVIHD
jgi:hypothetical protein